MISNDEINLQIRIINLLIATGIVFLSKKKIFGKSNPIRLTSWVLISTIAISILSGIEFANVNLLYGEITITIMVLTALTGFKFGSKFKIAIKSARITRENNRNNYYPPPHKTWIILSLIFLYMLSHKITGGNPISAIYSGVELKHIRLQMITVEKDFLILLLESMLISILSLLSIWSVLSLQNGKKEFLYILSIIVLYILSTGARSPFISFLSIYLVSIYYTKNLSIYHFNIYRKTRRHAITTFIIISLYLTTVTSARIDYEGLAISVFENYFQITSFGIIEQLVKIESSLIFTLSTIIVYIVSIVANLSIRVYESMIINNSFGYQFFFPYINFINIVTGTDSSTMKDLNENNITYLQQYSESATQWSSIYGDVIWDFGLYFSIPIVFLINFSFAQICKFPEQGIYKVVHVYKIYCISWLILPLVSPFSSMQFHLTTLAIIIVFLAKIIKFTSFKSHPTNYRKIESSVSTKYTAYETTN